MTIEELKKKLDEAHYIYDDTLVTTLAVALKLGRPLLIEGAAGVGKTEVAKVMAYALGRDLVRLQCYEGLDESKAIYEWNYQKQLLSIQVDQSLAKADGAAAKGTDAASGNGEGQTALLPSVSELNARRGWFDMIPAYAAGTIRPALTADGRLLRKGLASAGQLQS